MPESVKFEAFETFGDSQLIEMRDAARDFVGHLISNTAPRWLSFLGSSGAGKTFLSKLVWDWFKRSELHRTQINGEEIIYPGGFYSWRKTADMILAGDYSRVSDLCSERFVVLDDIGAEYRDKGGIVKAKLDRICDERVGKWTILTCNYSLQQIGEQMDTRIASRMLRGGSVVIDVDVTDYNLRRRAA